MQSSDADDSRPEIPGVTLEALLGQGGMATVYRGRIVGYPRPVAVKVLEGGSTDAILRRRFQREALLLARLEHPNIVSHLAAGETARGELFLMTELVDGGDLDAQVATRGPLSEHVGLGITAELASALEHALDHDAIHRDVKPGNVLLVPRAAGSGGLPFTAKLTDFGLALVRSIREGDPTLTRLTDNGHAVGTPATMAPEQIAGDNVDHRADIYGLGCTLHFALTGEFLHENASLHALFAAKLDGAPGNPHALDGLSKATAELIHCMTRPDPAERPQDYVELREMIERIPRSSPT